MQETPPGGGARIAGDKDWKKRGGADGEEAAPVKGLFGPGTAQ